MQPSVHLSYFCFLIFPFSIYYYNIIFNLEHQVSVCLDVMHEVGNMYDHNGLNDTGISHVGNRYIADMCEQFYN